MTTTPRQSRLLQTEGISLLEVLVIISIVGVLSTIAIAGFQMIVTGSKSDSAVATTINALRVGRDRAIAERRNYEVRFITPNQIELVREDIPTGTTVISDSYLENGQKFYQVSGVPDTPDAFGGTGPVAFGSVSTMMFASDGTFVSNTGDPLNGTVFLAVPGQATSARAITILGTTGLVHPWRWDGARWVD